jgi:hypothetical protein
VYLADRDAESSSPIPPDVSHQPCDAVPLSLMVAVSATGPGMGLQSRWYRQHRSPHAPDPPEPGETPVSPGSNQVRVQFHLVQRRADLHDQLKPPGVLATRYRTASGHKTYV